MGVEAGRRSPLLFFVAPRLCFVHGSVPGFRFLCGLVAVFDTVWFSPVPFCTAWFSRSVCVVSSPGSVLHGFARYGCPNLFVRCGPPRSVLVRYGASDAFRAIWCVPNVSQHFGPSLRVVRKRAVIVKIRRTLSDRTRRLTLFVFSLCCLFWTEGIVVHAWFSALSLNTFSLVFFSVDCFFSGAWGSWFTPGSLH